MDLRMTSDEEIIATIDEVMSSFVFEYLTHQLRDRIVAKLAECLPHNADGEGDGIIVCDDTNNTPRHFDLNEIRLDYYFKRNDQTYCIPRIMGPKGIRSAVGESV
jgi:hypothetical protein